MKTEEHLGELSVFEVNLIKDHRLKIMKEKIIKELRIEILKTAYEYEKWLQENGAGSTYSTFCDDFGYDGDKIINRRGFIFKCVDNVRRDLNFDIDGMQYDK